MRLGHLELFVADPLRSLEFYRDVLGFEVADVQGGRFVWVRAQGLELLLRPDRRQQAEPGPAHSGPMVVLYTEDLDGAARVLTGRGVSLRALEGDPGGFSFSDPDGHWFQLVNAAGRGSR